MSWYNTVMTNHADGGGNKQLQLQRTLGMAKPKLPQRHEKKQKESIRCCPQHHCKRWSMRMGWRLVKQSVSQESTSILIAVFKRWTELKVSHWFKANFLAQWCLPPWQKKNVTKPFLGRQNYLLEKQVWQLLGLSVIGLKIICSANYKLNKVHHFLQIINILTDGKTVF